jgi:hypothetical protein
MNAAAGMNALRELQKSCKDGYRMFFASDLLVVT